MNCFGCRMGARLPGGGAATLLRYPFLATALLLFLLPKTGITQQDPPSAAPISLAEAIQTAVRQNPLIHESASQAEMSAEQVVQARSGFMPRLDLVGGYSRTTSPAMAFSTKLNQETITQQDFDPNRLNNPDPADNYSGGVMAVWPVYDSGRTWYGTRQAEMRRKAADLALTRTRRQVIADTVSAYCGLLAAREHLEIVRRTLDTALANQHMVRSRFESGFVVKSDLLRTQVHVSDIEQQLFQAESRLEIARAGLNEVMGVPIERRVEPADKLTQGAEISGSLEHWIQTALEQRADLRRVAFEQDAAEAEIKKSRAAYLPSVSLTGNYQVNTEKFDDSADNYTIGAVVNFNLFSGLRDTSKVRESRAALDALRSAHSQIERRVRVETRQAYLQAQSAWKRIRVAKAAVDQAAEALRIVGSRYGNGLMTILDLLNSELELQQANTRHLYALHDYQVARAQLMLAAGELDETFQ